MGAIPGRVTTTLGSITEAIAAELEEVELLLRSEVAAEQGVLGDAIGLILDAGGKRLRPALVVLLAGAPADRHPMITAAAAIELIHSATLVHDDVIDHSDTRRGRQAVHARHGEAVAIITGDHLLTRGYALLASVSPAAVTAASDAVSRICRGEVRQQAERFNLTRTMDEYEHTVSAKTGALLECAAALASICSGHDASARDAARGYAIELGIAYQLADDLLDYTGTDAALGKPAGADLREGMVTAPLILALADAGIGARLRSLLAHPDDAAVDEAVAIVRSSPVCAEVAAMARQRGDRAVAALTPLTAAVDTTALAALADYVVSRTR